MITGVAEVNDTAFSSLVCDWRFLSHVFCLGPEGSTGACTPGGNAPKKKERNEEEGGEELGNLRPRWWRRATEDNANVEDENMLANIDFTPTVLALAVMS